MRAAAPLRATAPTVFHTDLTILTIRLLQPVSCRIYTAS